MTALANIVPNRPMTYLLLKQWKFYLALPYLRKICNSSSRENLVMMSAYEQATKRTPSIQTLGVEEGRLVVRLRDMQPWFTVYFFDIGHPSIDSCQNKVFADQYHVTISWAQVYSSLRSHVFLKLTADQVLVFEWISCQVNLLKTGQDCSEAGKH